MKGNVYSAGKNEGGRLGHGDTVYRWGLKKIPSFGRSAGRVVVDVSCGSNYSAAITDKGASYNSQFNHSLH